MAQLLTSLKLSPQTPEYNFQNPPTWYLLPNPPSIFGLTKYGLTAAYTVYEAAGKSPFPSKFRGPPRAPHIPFFTERYKVELYGFIVRNQRFRWQMKRLIHRWRLARLRQANTDDLVTMEPPKRPVTIVDWPTRTRYVFEASTLFREICAKLTQCEELFPTPLYPRNPYTNQPLSLGQLHFVSQDLRAAGQTNWATETFVNASYCLTLYKKVANTQLRIHALKRHFANPTEEGYIDTLYDFIDFSYEEGGEDMQHGNLWLWFLRNRPHYPHIQMLRSLCYEYYFGLITLSSDAFNTLKDRIMVKTAALLERKSIQSMLVLYRANIKGPMNPEE